MTAAGEAGKPLYDDRRGLALWGAEEVDAVVEVLRARAPFRYAEDSLGATAAFERALAAATGSDFAACLSSGTAALFCALIALDLPDGAEVVLPAVTFVACVNAVVWARCTPVFAEVDESLTLDPARLEEKITPRTAVVMPVHLAGVAADMDPILDVATANGLPILEDAAQAAGVSYRGRAVGSIGRAGAFSFQSEKNVALGEGGAVVTDDRAVYDRVVRLQDQGGQFATQRGARSHAADAPLIGLNLRMTEIAAAIGRVQLARLGGMVGGLRRRAGLVKEAVADLGLTWRPAADETGSVGDLTFYLANRMAARECSYALQREGIPAGTMYGGLPVYATESVRRGQTPWGTKFEVTRCRSSEQLLGRSVTVRLGAAMMDADAERVAAALRKVAPPAG